MGPTQQSILVKEHMNFEAMSPENPADDGQESVFSQGSVASVVSGDDRRSKRLISITKMEESLKEELVEQKVEQKTWWMDDLMDIFIAPIISITRKKESLKDESQTNGLDDQKVEQKTRWMDDLVDMFIVPKAELHINDDRGILTKDKSIERLINFFLAVSIILAGLATAILTIFEASFGLTKIISSKAGMVMLIFHILSSWRLSESYLSQNGLEFLMFSSSIRMDCIWTFLRMERSLQ